jgi:hypothetical protein
MELHAWELTVRAVRRRAETASTRPGIRKRLGRECSIIFMAYKR